MLVKIITEYGVCRRSCLGRGTSGRSELFSEYKAQRRSRPDLLKRSGRHGTSGGGVRYSNVRVEATRRTT